jgi:CoA binding protein
MIDDVNREQLLRIYSQSRTIAVVGASADESKAAHRIPGYLQRQGYRILPVNPRGGELFGEHVFRSLIEREGTLVTTRYRLGGGPAHRGSCGIDRRHGSLYGRHSCNAWSGTRTGLRHTRKRHHDEALPIMVSLL